jgi:hypothetical protein
MSAGSAAPPAAAAPGPIQKAISDFLNSKGNAGKPPAYADAGKARNLAGKWNNAIAKNAAAKAAVPPPPPAGKSKAELTLEAEAAMKKATDMSDTDKAAKAAAIAAAQALIDAAKAMTGGRRRKSRKATKKAKKSTRKTKKSKRSRKSKGRK